MQQRSWLQAKEQPTARSSCPHFEAGCLHSAAALHVASNMEVYQTISCCCCSLWGQPQAVLFITHRLRMIGLSNFWGTGIAWDKAHFRDVLCLGTAGTPYYACHQSSSVPVVLAIMAWQLLFRDSLQWLSRILGATHDVTYHLCRLFVCASVLWPTGH